MPSKKTLAAVPIKTNLRIAEIRSSEDVADFLKDSRGNWDRVIDLVRALDNVSVNHIYQTDAPKVTYCKAYLFALFNRFCEKGEDREILLMAFGLLEGYQAIANVTDRRKEYMTHMECSLGQKAIDGTVRRTEDEIIELLAVKLVEAMNANNGILGIANTMQQDYVLPVPKYSETSRLWQRGRGKNPRVATEKNEQSGTKTAFTPEVPSDPETSAEQNILSASISTPLTDRPTTDNTGKEKKRVSKFPKNVFGKHSKAAFGITIGLCALVALILVLSVLFPSQPRTYPPAKSYESPVDTTEIVARISTDPAFGYMVAIGLIETIEENSLLDAWAENGHFIKIQEFVEMTNKGQSDESGLDLSMWYSPDDGTDNTISLEYNNYSSAIIQLLFFGGSKQKKEEGVSKRNWSVKSISDPHNVQIEENEIQVESPWTTITFDFPAQERYVVFGISLYDMRFAYLDPSSLKAYYTEEDWHNTGT